MIHQVKYHQRSRKAGSKQPANTKYCGRTTAEFDFGNSFSEPGTGLTQGVSVNEFQQWVNGTDWHDYLQEERQWILDHLHELTSYDFLSCWCRRYYPCHVQQILIPKVNTLIAQAP